MRQIYFVFLAAVLMISTAAKAHAETEAEGPSEQDIDATCHCTDPAQRAQVKERVRLLGENGILVTFVPGFYPINHAIVPQAVKTAGQSVFGIIYPTEIVSITPQEAQNYLAQEKDQDIRAIFSIYLNICVQARTAKCDVPASYDTGSGFLFGQADQLHTSAHVFREMKKLGNNLQGKLPLFIFNSRHQIVINGLAENIQITSMGFEATRANFKFTVSEDYVTIKLPKPLGQPLKVATALEPGEQVFNVGYPNNSPARTPFRSAQNRDEQVSTGHHFPFADGQLQQMYSALFESNGYGSIGVSSQVYYSTADAMNGQSGGPQLNSQGEVIGLVSMAGAGEVPNKPFQTFMTFATRPSAWPRLSSSQK